MNTTIDIASTKLKYIISLADLANPNRDWTYFITIWQDNTYKIELRSADNINHILSIQYYSVTNEYKEVWLDSELFETKLIAKIILKKD